jgi:nitrite reductase/ring-hydroxylating ferredoxin subunit
VRVPGAARLEHGQTRRFSFERSGAMLEGFVLCHHAEIFAYANACPHWNVDLDLGFGDFYDSADDRIFCRNHGALFKPRTGFCDFGPCAGHSLERFEIETDGDDALVWVPEKAPYLGPSD